MGSCSCQLFEKNILCTLGDNGLVIGDSWSILPQVHIGLSLWICQYQQIAGIINDWPTVMESMGQKDGHLYCNYPEARK